MDKNIKIKYKNSKKQIKSAYKAEKKTKKLRFKEEKENARESFIAEREAYYLENGKPVPENPPKRSLLEEIGNAVSHGVGAAFAIVAIVLMLIKAVTRGRAFRSCNLFRRSFRNVLYQCPLSRFSVRKPCKTPV